MSKELIRSNYESEKRYIVYIEQAKSNYDGYRYMEPQYASLITDKKSFKMIFYFKDTGKNKNKQNPSFTIESVEGDSFPERIDIINHFKMHHAISYAVALDGLSEFLFKESDNDKS